MVVVKKLWLKLAIQVLGRKLVQANQKLVQSHLISTVICYTDKLKQLIIGLKPQ